MEMRMYYQKLRQVEATIPAEYTVVVSLETGDGGAAGVLTEVTRRNAARLFVEGRARQATAEEAADFRTRQAEASLAAELAAKAARVQVSVISESDLRALKAGAKGSKP